MNTQIQQIVKMFLNFPQLLQSWSATEFVFLSEESVGFKVSTPNYNGTVIIIFQDNSFYSVLFRDLEFKILGIYRDGESYAYLSTGKHLPAEFGLFGLTPTLRR